MLRFFHCAAQAPSKNVHLLVYSRSNPLDGGQGAGFFSSFFSQGKQIRQPMICSPAGYSLPQRRHFPPYRIHIPSFPYAI